MSDERLAELVHDTVIIIQCAVDGKGQFPVVVEFAWFDTLVEPSQDEAVNSASCPIGNEMVLSVRGLDHPTIVGLPF